jgi:hypothetical protein
LIDREADETGDLSTYYKAGGTSGG